MSHDPPFDRIILLPQKEEMSSPITIDNKVLAPPISVDDQVLTPPEEIDDRVLVSEYVNFSDDESETVYGSVPTIIDFLEEETVYGVRKTGSELLNSIRNREDRPSFFSNDFWEGVAKGYDQYKEILNKRQKEYDEIYSVMYPIYLETEKERTNFIRESILGIGEGPSIEERANSYVEEGIGPRPSNVFKDLAIVVASYFGPQLLEKALTLIRSLSIEPINLETPWGYRNLTIGKVTPKSRLMSTPWGPRDAKTGKFASGPREGRDPEIDFIKTAENKGFKVLGRKITVKTPFGEREVDVVIQGPNGEIGGVEIKSSKIAFKKFDSKQFCGDNWINIYGAKAVGENAARAGISKLDYTLKILWE